MQFPVISRPLEPALFARAADLERHRVAPGGLTVVAYLVLAGVAGVLAAIWPARRAAKLNVLEAIAYE